MIWQDDAACAGDWDLFDRTDVDSVELQKLICAACPVTDECRELAKQGPPPFGTWAGEYYPSYAERYAKRQGERLALDQEIAKLTTTEVRKMHAAYVRGIRDPLTLAGERAYGRNRARRRREKEAA